jgi:DNA-binding transcriptional MerR regulator
MHSCDLSNSPGDQDVFWVDTDTKDESANSAQSEFTIGELARHFGITLRALRFYEGRGLLTPQRDGLMRTFSRADRDRLALILKGKKLGFTLGEIGEMIDAQAGTATQQGLKLTAEKCLQQIAHFERQMREAGEALAELRQIHLSLCVQAAKPAGATPGGESAS